MHSLFFRAVRIFLLIATAAILTWGFMRLGSFLSAPSGMPIHADLIVSLGGDAGARVSKAQQLFDQGYAPKILLTGIEGSDPVTRAVYFSWQELFLKQHGIDKSVLLFDTQSANTWQEAINTREMMAQRGYLRVLVVSDPPHMRRLSWVWGRVFANSGLEFRLIASDMPQWSADGWWHNEKLVQFVITEMIKLGYYLARY